MDTSSQPRPSLPFPLAVGVDSQYVDSCKFLPKPRKGDKTLSTKKESASGGPSCMQASLSCKDERRASCPSRMLLAAENKAPSRPGTSEAQFVSRDWDPTGYRCGFILQMLARSEVAQSSRILPEHCCQLINTFSTESLCLSAFISRNAVSHFLCVSSPVSKTRMDQSTDLSHLLHEGGSGTFHLACTPWTLSQLLTLSWAARQPT